MNEKDKLNEVRLKLQDEFGLTTWRNNVGLFLTKKGKKVYCGLKKGSSDLIGISKSGKFVAVEVKTKNGKLSKEQKEFLNFIKSQKGISILAVLGEKEKIVFKMRKSF